MDIWWLKLLFNILYTEILSKDKIVTHVLIFRINNYNIL